MSQTVARLANNMVIILIHSEFGIVVTSLLDQIGI
eukprot:COSAG02_NODE_2953_length_7672_cov_2.308464_3_plen_35_part_00